MFTNNTKKIAESWQKAGQALFHFVVYKFPARCLFLLFQNSAYIFRSFLLSLTISYRLLISKNKKKPCYKNVVFTLCLYFNARIWYTCNTSIIDYIWPQSRFSPVLPVAKMSDVKSKRGLKNILCGARKILGPNVC
jgi:hypothetical protein